MSQMFSISEAASRSKGVGLPFIPPHLLLNFMAAAQYKSVSHAATVQCMPKAILAQNISRLETLLGDKLIVQEPGKFDLTEKGIRVFKAIQGDASEMQIKVQSALMDADLTDYDITRPMLSLDINIWGFAAALRPKLQDLRALDCGMDFISPKKAVKTNADVVCYLAAKPRAGYRNHLLFAEEIITVCSAYYPMPDGGFEAETVVFEPLLHMGHPNHESDWHSFLGLDDADDLPGIPKAPYESFSRYIRALRAGRGLGIGMAPLFAEELRAGTLKIASDRCVQRDRAVYVGVAEGCEHPDLAQSFADIVIDAFKGVAPA